MNIDGYSGATRIYPIIGDPIAQVKSPISMTTGFRARRRDALVVPIHVTGVDADRAIEAFSSMRNVDGFLATVPHKFLAFRHCRTATPRARLLEAANVVRRNSDGSWHGDMVDGLSFVRAAEGKGCRFIGKQVLLSGAGGAGSALGLEMLNAGATALAVHDIDLRRRDMLIAKLSIAHAGKVRVGSDDPSGFDVVVNATPMGMQHGDPAPIQLDKLSSEQFAGDVITAPELTPLLLAAKASGAAFSTGLDMIRASVDIQVDFFLTEEA